MEILNFITSVSIIVAVSSFVEIAIPVVFVQNIMILMMDNKLNLVGNATSGNVTSVTENVTETESLPTVDESGYSNGGPGDHERGGGQVCDP